MLPIGPKGEKRPDDVVGKAVLVAKLAVGEAEEQYVDGKPKKRARRKVVRRTKSLPAKLYPAMQEDR